MPQQTTFRIALDWTPNTLHSGLYLALHHGYYQKHNLSVELLPPDAQYTKTPAKRLAGSEVDLAICPSESCIAYNESGALQLQAIYAILQEDAAAIVGLENNLNRIGDLGQGKKYGSYNARYEDAIVAEMVKQDGGNDQGIEIERSEGKLNMFEAVKSGKIDATWIFVPWEGVETELEGVKAKNFRLEDYGIPYGYSPVIARNAGKSPSDDVLRAFVQATRQGYEHAMKHPEDVVEVLREVCVPKRSEEFLRKSQESINHYYSDGKGKLGSMEAAKWTAWLKWLRDREMLIEDSPVTEEKIFTNEFAE
ncbi:Formylaminopyrimidine-binding protein [Fulvia fulva]|nr:Formylaminopyrimidine-binding protein [Fulvia fulva]